MRIYKVLQTEALAQRPTKPPTECPSWSAQLLWQVAGNRIHQCPHESDVVDMLNFPLASPGEHFGVVRRFQPFMDGGLESARLHAVTQPSIAWSVWIYLLRWCQQELCGIIHHVGPGNVYDSVLMQLTDAGDVIIQARVTTGEDKAFRAAVVLPHRKWIRLDCYIQDSKVLLDTTWDNETRRYPYEFEENIRYDDTEGYFVIGGSRFLQGIHGYFGPIRYYRLGSEEVELQPHPDSALQQLDEAHQECQEMKTLTRAFLQEVSESHVPVDAAAACSPHRRLWAPAGEKVCTQTWSWETQLKHSTLFHFLQTKEEEIRTGSWDLKQLRGALFEQAVGTMFTAEQNNITCRTTALLQISSCFGNHGASLLLASLHLSGLGASVHHQQGHVYSLIGASGDNRFALMHAGYKHAHGFDGFPKDLDVAYSYYSNAGTQSIIDSRRTHENEQHTLEHIYLSNPEDLNRLTHETSDVFEYLKYQAENGDVDSQKRLGRMLFWGQLGVSKDTASALKWFKRSAMQMTDPSAMYDYAVLLMKGLGVKRNFSRGVQLLEKAAAMGSINALNVLGWYHSIKLHDHSKAVKYFQQAALNGSDDGMFNLGLYQLSGTNPDSPGRNETAAFLHFLSASRLGHVAASVEAAGYLSTGALEGVSQDVERAVIMLKKVCEQNGHLGLVIRDALQAYLRGCRQEAFVKYVLAAEAGLGLAQSNAAYLCEEGSLPYDCQWRYHNLSILNYDPHPSALLKMGDQYCSSSSGPDSLSSLAQAISMYGRAAEAGSPQGMYNLVVLVQQGHALPPNIQRLFNASHHQDLVLNILQRCVDTEEAEAVTPCSVALLRVQMEEALRRMSQPSAQLVLTYASLLSVLVIIVILPLEHRVSRAAMGGALGAAENLRRSILSGEQRLLQTCEVAVTLAGVCLCAFGTTLLYHLSWQ